jgi:hypothetical protein
MSVVSPVYPDAVYHQVELYGVWTEIGQYVVSDVTGYYGIEGTKTPDLVAVVGQISLQLNNATGKFSPDGDGSPLFGWRKGIPYRVMIKYQGSIRVVFIGRLRDIEFDNEPLLGERRVSITVTDWMGVASTHPLHKAVILTQQYLHTAVANLLALIPIQPYATQVGTGTFLFPTFLDSVTKDTKPITEFQKLAMSEYAPIYVKKEGTLVAENRLARNGLVPIANVTVTGGFLLKEDGGLLLQENSDEILVDDTTPALLDAMQTLEVHHGSEMVNSIQVRANPRRADTSLEILFSLDQPMPLQSSKTMTFSAYFKDPRGGGTPINGTNIQTPVLTTDYLVFQNSDGTGTNYTASAVVTAVVYSDHVDFSVYLATATAYLTKCNIRGWGIYRDNPITQVIEDEDSINEYGTFEENLDQDYKANLEQGKQEARSILADRKQPKTDLKGAHYTANTNEFLMNAFLGLDIGSAVNVYNEKHGIDTYAWIQRIDFKIGLQGMPIEFDHKYKTFRSLNKGLREVAIEFSGLPAVDAIDFGFIPLVTGYTSRSYSFWIWLDNWSVGLNAFAVSMWSDAGGNAVLMATDGSIHFDAKYTPSQGFWRTPTGLVTTGSWHHVVVTKVMNVIDPPIIYFNNSIQTLTVLNAPSGTLQTENLANFVLGNSKTATFDFSRGIDGKLKHVRVYNRVINSTEIAYLYAHPTEFGAVTDGLVFQGPTIATSEYDDNLDRQIDQPVILDNIFGYRGAPSTGSSGPIVRAI